MIATLALVAALSSAAPAGRVVEFPVARAYVPFLQPSRYKGAFGGRGSAKSHEFAKNVLKRCIEKPGSRVVCVREIQRTLEQSVKRLLEDKIEAFGVQDQFKSTNTQVVTPGEGVIIFQGMQDHTAESIKSLEGFDVAWVEEAQTVSKRSLTLLRPTIREPGSELWFSWNPRHSTDPVDELFRGAAGPPPDSIVVETSWRDNPWFPDVLRKEMEWDRGRDVELYDHVWGGGYEKRSNSRVFKNWRIEDIEPPPNTVFYHGGDWGFSVDPTVLIRTWLLGEKTLVVDAEAYRVGCEIDDTPKLFDGLVCGCDYLSPHPCRHQEQHGDARNWQVRADSARPETISYLQKHGYPQIVAATKGPNSVKEGVIFLQGYDIVVRPRCVHAINELTHYSYVVDKQTGVVTPILEDKKNHVIDSLRYATEGLREGAADWVTW